MSRMDRFSDRRRGSAVLYTIILSPILFLCLALALEAGAIELQKARLRSAADVATSTASASVSFANGDLASLGRDRADAAARASLRDNLLPLEAQMRGSNATRVSEDADIALVTAVPARSPYDQTTTLSRPTLLIRMRVPVSSGLLSVAGLPATLTLTILSSSDLRVVGGAAP